MTYYSKLIAVLVGLAIILAGRYGIDLEGSQPLITDAIGSIVAAVGVYLAKNKPQTPAQIVQVEQVLIEAKAENGG